MRDPQNGWFVMENLNLKWMITRGTTFMETPMDNNGFIIVDPLLDETV
jgi:hypothetical protein